VVSGGISNIKDIKKLHKAELFEGVIIGKAIYDKSISLNELRKFL
jgi:phosphoribosylformimino-5-aminoimidazole carboxamide ribonucleotide (ProFAR) isomerase